MNEVVDLYALGKYWGRLLDGRYLEVRRHDDRVATIDLQESARAGRPVIVRLAAEPDNAPERTLE